MGFVANHVLWPARHYQGSDSAESSSALYPVLDDLHWVTEPATYLALDYSLARLGARGQLTEFRVLDLRFTLDEAQVLLNEALSLRLSPDDITTLHARTEGWPTGLCFLAGSLGGC